MTKWEYDAEHFMPQVEGRGLLSGAVARDRAAKLVAVFVETLNRRAKDGWEFVGQEQIAHRNEAFNSTKDLELTVLVFRRARP